MSRARLSRAAEADLRAIGQFIAVQSPQNALAVVAQLRGAVGRLTEFPGMGRSAPELRRGARVWVVHSYLIVYRATRDGILVLRIVHGALDLTTMFQRRS